jgi:hypothetical protein
MARKPKWREILPVLEERLDRVIAGEVNLPTEDRRTVNLVQLMRDLSLKEDDRQYFYKYAELYGLLNAVSATFGLAPIGRDGSGASADLSGAVVRARLAEQGAAIKDVQEENVELRAVVRRLTEERNATARERDEAHRELGQLQDRLTFLQETGQIFRAKKVRDP